MSQTHFVDILLPLPVEGTFTYRVPRELEKSIEYGKRVVVQFGRKKIYSGLILNIHQTAPTKYEAKYILSVLDETPIIIKQQEQLWRWISSYYLCSLGEVMLAAIPGALNLSSETKLAFDPDYEKQGEDLLDSEFLIFEAIQSSGTLTLNEVASIVDEKTIHPIVSGLQQKGVITLHEELQHRYKPKEVAYVKLASHLENQEKLKVVFEDLSRAPKQLKALTTYIQLSNFFNVGNQSVKKQKVEDKGDISSSVINQLIKKEILIEEKLSESRIDKTSNNHLVQHELSADQNLALENISESFTKQNVCLLHGITSSGKTEIYIDLISKTLQEGKQVLFLVPEIALTTQLIQRLKVAFGDLVGVFHSKYNTNQRVEVWLDLLKVEPRFKIVIGARSAVFMPFTNLGLVIVDEEHENTYKQFEPNPKYNARDTAIVLANIFEAKVLLGTATPSLESYYNAKTNKYGYVTLNKRHKNITPPEIWVADLKNDRKKKKMKGIFSELLIEEMEKAFKDNQQVILFKNRRGYSPFLQCQSCGHSPECIRCDITLTYHKKIDLLKCHYCGYSTQLPTNCPKCNSIHIKTVGFGTEKIEEELQIYFPNIKIGRMDLETTRTRNAYERIINEFDEGEIDVLVGTQMVSKGLDFKNVALVGILDADSMISFPDFRAHERAFQLMTQVAGRAGRYHKRGKVVIQTMNPYHFVIQKVIENNYEDLALQLMRERKRFNYPPYYRTIKITVKHKEKNKVDDLAEKLANRLKAIFKDDLVGPEYPHIAWVRAKYNKNILLKIGPDKNLKSIKNQIIDLKNRLIAENKFNIYGVLIDVDSQ